MESRGIYQGDLYAIVIFTIIISVSTMGCSGPNRDVITVSAAASLQQAFNDIAADFEHANPGIRVDVNYASSGTLRAQIEQGAPVDIFASASVDHMDILQNRGLVFNGSRKNFAGNHLVIILPHGSNKNIRLSNLGEADRIALGDPSHVPAGRYAQEALDTAGLWPEVKDDVIYAANVRQVLDYVVRGEVDAGFVYMTDVTDDVTISQRVPSTLHSPIIYTLAVLEGSYNLDAANRFVEHVIESGQILEQYGFTAGDMV